MPIIEVIGNKDDKVFKDRKDFKARRGRAIYDL